MGASNQSQNGGKKSFFKLKEDKQDKSDSKGCFRFYKQVKDGEVWKDGATFNAMSGHLTSINTKSYEWQGKKEVLEFTLTDDKDEESVVSIGLDSNTARSIVNTFAGEDNLGELLFECGQPKEYNGKTYPTLYIKNNGNKTAWKYCKANNNENLIPKVTSKVDEDGNTIKSGVKANVEFWKNIVAEIQSGLKPKSAKDKAVADSIANSKDLDDDGQLPF